MEIFRPDSKFTLKSRSPLITIGSFDGLHLGHQMILNILRNRAKSLKTACGVVTFSPLPIIHFSPSFTYLITTEQERESLIAKLGVDFIFYFKFDRQFSQFEPNEFLGSIKRTINPRAIIVGQNHHFGKNQKGNANLLKMLGRQLKISIRTIKPKIIGNTKVSSTGIREALLLGNVALANRMLGREYSISGTVVKGAGRGHQLGFPTINIQVRYQNSIDANHKLVPLDGVYVTKVLFDNKIIHSVMSIGYQPTFGEIIYGAEKQMEIHLLDFKRDLYGLEVEVFFIKRLRPIKRFKDRNALIEAIKEDIKKTRHYFQLK